ncbi:MAG: DegT/DnrJ/EryC1/StrS aminotransferase family protein [bacterium]|nr:DegT/DnrJ/EryC1/StrS aminotransferase family protein [bacterium]
MTDIQAAIGLRQRAGSRPCARRRELVARHNAAFGDLDACELPVERPEVQHAWHLHPLRLRSERLAITRDAFIEELRARNIGTSVHFIPIHTFTYYRRRYGYRPEDSRWPQCVADPATRTYPTRKNMLNP